MLKKVTFAVLTAALFLAIVESLTAQPPERGFGGRRGRGFAPAQEQQPLPANEAEKKILSVLDDMNRNQSRGMMNVPQADGRMLRLLTEAVGARHVVEIARRMGTRVSGSAWPCGPPGES